jgi:hypothetical protein
MSAMARNENMSEGVGVLVLLCVTARMRWLTSVVLLWVSL